MGSPQTRSDQRKLHHAAPTHGCSNLANRTAEMTQYSNRSGEGDRDSCNLQVRSNASSCTPTVATTSLLPPKDEGHCEGHLKTLEFAPSHNSVHTPFVRVEFQEVRLLNAVRVSLEVPMPRLTLSAISDEARFWLRPGCIASSWRLSMLLHFPKPGDDGSFLRIVLPSSIKPERLAEWTDREKAVRPWGSQSNERQLARRDWLKSTEKS